MKYICAIFLLFCMTACTQQPIKNQQSSALNPTQKRIKSRPQKISDTYPIWISQPINQQKVNAYKAFLSRKGLAHYIPDDEFFQSARDWQKCSMSEFDVPPQEIWGNIVPTLHILKLLIEHNILDQFTVTSVYRNFNLNRCAQGADTSRHIFNAAMDFRIGTEQPDQIEHMQIQETKKKLCQFWLEQGEMLNMGLGIYSSGQIHLDSAGYRTWGPDHRRQSSPCIDHTGKKSIS